jgi:hypothetical protein
VQRAGWGAALDIGDDVGAAAREAARLVDRADEPADYGRWMHRWLWPALAAVAVTAGMVVGGVDLWRAVAVAIGVAVALWSVIASIAAPRIRWHDDVPGRRYHATSSWEVPGLDGARESDTTFRHYLRPRLWATAAELLQVRGIDPAGAQARQLVGPRLYDALTDANADPRMLPPVSALSHAIARLAVDATLPGRPPVDTPALAGLAGAPRGRRPRSAGRHSRPPRDATTDTGSARQPTTRGLQ